jgi:hypothetical protein
MSQTGTPTEFLQLGITEPDDTLNVLVDLNGQWRKIDTGVKNVDIKATTNASNITTLQGAVQDNTENITNILDTNVNQQNSIDTLQTKVAALEEDDSSYGSRITAVENGVQENSELINDLEVEVSGVKLDMGTVPSGSNLQGEVDGLDTRVTALENSGSVASVEARVTALEGSVGTVPVGETVEGQISGLDTDVTALQGQVNSGNIPFRFSVDGGGNYGYLKADDSFVPFSSGDSHWHVLDRNLYATPDDKISYIVKYKDFSTESSPNYKKLRDIKHNIDYTLPDRYGVYTVGNIIMTHNTGNIINYIANNGNLTTINGGVAGVQYNSTNDRTYYLIRSGNNITYNVVDGEGNSIGQPINYTLHGNASGGIYLIYDDLYYRYNSTYYRVKFNIETGTYNETTPSSGLSPAINYYFIDSGTPSKITYGQGPNSEGFPNVANVICTVQSEIFIYSDSNYYYYL